MTIGGQFFNDDGLVQITDELESMVCLGEWGDQEGRQTECLAVTHGGKRFKFGPISQATIPGHGVGLELFNAEGKRMFSSLVHPAAIIGAIKADANQPVAEVRGKPSRKYGLCVFGSSMISIPIDIRSVEYGGQYWDDYWEYNLKVKYIDYDTFDWGIKTKLVEEIWYGYDSPDYPIASAGRLSFEAVVFDVTALV